MAEWLDKNVREDEYMEMKEKAKVMEEMVNGWQVGIWYHCINKREPKKTCQDRIMT